MGQWRFPEVPGAELPEAETPSDEPRVPDGGVAPMNTASPQRAKPDAPRDGIPREPDEKPPLWRRRLVWGALALVAASLLTGAVVTVVRLYPWMKGPATPPAVIDERWAKVEHWARIDAPDASDDLGEISRGAAGFRPPADDLPLLQREQLEVEQVEAVDALVRWRERGAAFAPRLCDSPSRGGSSLPVFRLGQLAVFTAEGADELDQVRAVLALGQRMRQRGTLLELVIGTSLANLAAKWSQARRTPLPQSFAAYRPDASEIHGALARDAVCVARMLEAEGSKGLSLDSPLLGDSSRPRPPFGFVDVSRELRVYKDFHGRLLTQSYDVRSDWQKVAEVFEHAEATKPASVLLDAASIKAGVIRRAGEDVDRYRALVP